MLKMVKNPKGVHFLKIGALKFLFMIKVQRISKFQYKILFNSIEDNMELYCSRFCGHYQIYTSIPFDFGIYTINW